MTFFTLIALYALCKHSFLIQKKSVRSTNSTQAILRVQNIIEKGYLMIFFIHKFPHTTTTIQ